MFASCASATTLATTTRVLCDCLGVVDLNERRPRDVLADRYLGNRPSTRGDVSRVVDLALHQQRHRPLPDTRSTLAMTAITTPTMIARSACGRAVSAPARSCAASGLPRVLLASSL
jgi:hypothetical protein